MQSLTKREFDLYSRAVAALAGAESDRVLADGPGLAHQIHDAAMHQVDELRTNVRAERLHRQRRTRR